MNKKIFAVALGGAAILGGLSIGLFASPSPAAAAGAPTISFVGGVVTSNKNQIPGFNFYFPTPGDDGEGAVIIKGSNFICDSTTNDTADTVTIDGVTASVGVSCFYGTQLTFVGLSQAVLTSPGPSRHTVTVTNAGGTATSAFWVIPDEPSFNLTKYSVSAISGGYYYTFTIPGTGCNIGYGSGQQWSCNSANITTYLPYVPSDWSAHASNGIGNFSGSAPSSCTLPPNTPAACGANGELFGAPFNAQNCAAQSLNQAVNVGAGQTYFTSGGPGTNCSGGSFTIGGSFHLTACQPGYTAGDGTCTQSAQNNGIINVSSINSANQHSVNASWGFVAPPGSDPCTAGHGSYCGTSVYATQGTYTGLNANDSSYSPIPINAKDPAGQFSMNSVENEGAPSHHITTPNVFALLQNALSSVPTANAADVSPISSSLTHSSPTANFTIAWDPLAKMTATPSQSLSNLSPINTSGQVTIENSGTEGSVLSGLAVQSINYSYGSGWLSVASLAGISLSQGQPGKNITITADPSNLTSAGSPYFATIKFTGQSTGNPTSDYSSQNLTKDVTVTLVVPSSGGPGNPGGPLACTTPGIIMPIGQVTFTATGGTGTYSSWSAPTGVPTSGGAGATFSSLFATTGNDTVTVTDSSGKSASCSVTMGIPPTVALSLSQTPMTVGQSDTLSWITTNANSCTATASPTQANWSGSEPTNGSLEVSPAVGTYVYTLTCLGNNGLTNSDSKTLVVNSAPAAGSITVSSVNVDTGGGVVDGAGWKLTGNGTQTDSSLQQKTYTSEPAGSYSLSANTTPAPAGYVFNDIFVNGGGQFASAANPAQGTLTSGGSLTYYIRWKATTAGTSPTCSPFPLTVATNQSVTFTATGGSGSYSSWSAVGGSSSSGGAGATFSTSYTTTGSKTVTVTDSNSNSGTCLVTVTPPLAPTATLTASPASGCGVYTGAITAGSSVDWNLYVTDPGTSTLKLNIGGAANTAQTENPNWLVPGLTFTLKAQSDGSVLKTLTLGSSCQKPTIALTASPTSITLGQSASLFWDTANATVCTAVATPVENDWSGAQPTGAGQQQPISPTTVGPHTYTLNCTGPGGNSIDNATITVTPVNNPSSLTCSPASQNAKTDDTVFFTAGGGSGAYSWTSTGASPSQQNGSRFQTTYPSVGSYTATVNDGANSKTCDITVTQGSGNPNSSIGSVSAACDPTSISIGDHSSCNATVTGVGNYSSAVTWSVVSGGGSIDASGRYTAPGNTGTVTVKAVSTQDPTKSGTTNVTVTGGGGPIGITPGGPGGGIIPVGIDLPIVGSGGCGNYTWSSTGPASPATGAGNTYTVSYSASGLFTVTLTDSCGNKATAPITVIAPNCTFTADPNQIIPPQTSALKWNCTNAVSCTINGAAVQSNMNGTSLSGSLSVSPTQNSTYALSCRGSGAGAANIVNVTTSVSVSGPGVHETNP